MEWAPFEGVQSGPELRSEYRSTQQTLISIAVPAFRWATRTSTPWTS